MSIRRLRKSFIAVTLVAITGMGCAFGEFRWHDPMGRQMALEEIQKRYTNLIRFGAFDKAIVYVHPDFREEYIANKPGPELRFSDFEMFPIDGLTDELTKATVTVSYLVYNMASLYQYKIIETQAWEREGQTWMVRPEFESLEPPVSAR